MRSDYGSPDCETGQMGLFGSRKRENRMALEQLPPLPPRAVLANFLPTSRGEYIAKDSFTGDDKDTFREVRKIAAEAFRNLGIKADSEQREYVGVVLRAPSDPSVIWVSVEGELVDRLLTSAVTTFPVEWVGPSPVAITLARWKSSGLHAVEVNRYEPTG